MNPLSTLMLPVTGLVLVVFIFAAIWASRYVKVGPNRVLIVSGRQHQLADATRRGFRIVKGGGTFVIPVVEKPDVLSLEVLIPWAWASSVSRFKASGESEVETSPIGAGKTAMPRRQRHVRGIVLCCGERP